METMTREKLKFGEKLSLDFGQVLVWLGHKYKP